MALPTIYCDTGGATTNSGSSDNNSPIIDSVTAGTTASATGSTVTFSGATDLSGVPTDGSATIRLADATNSNRKIFQITGVNDGADTVTVTGSPTGVATSAWAIGGRLVVTGGNFDSDLSGSLASGWVVTFNNSPASHSGSDFIIPRTNGGSTGCITIKGTTGSRPVLTVTDTNQVVQDNATARQFWHFENLEMVQQGASGACFQIGTAGSICNRVYNCKISDAGAACCSTVGTAIVASEMTGGGTTGCLGTQTSASNSWQGNYIHDNTTVGIQIGGNSGWNFIFGNIIDTNGTRGIYNSQSTTGVSVVITNNTIYGQGDSGIEFTDIDTSADIYGNILLDNGNAAGEFNVELVSGADVNGIICHGNNCFSIAGSAGGANFSNFSAGSTDITSDPQLTSAAAGDFTLGASSGCRQTGFPASWLGLSITGYPDMGAVQAQATAGGSRFPFGGMTGGLLG